MELLELENLAKKEKINLVTDIKMNRKAQIVDYDNTTCIFMNCQKIDTSTEEKCVLAEELRSLLSRCLLYPIFFAREY